MSVTKQLTLIKQRVRFHSEKYPLWVCSLYKLRRINKAERERVVEERIPRPSEVKKELKSRVRRELEAQEVESLTAKARITYRDFAIQSSGEHR